jgi:hypothetical protein
MEKVQAVYGSGDREHAGMTLHHDTRRAVYMFHYYAAVYIARRIGIRRKHLNGGYQSCVFNPFAFHDVTPLK